ncbi:hypothetical protein [Spirosoma areae]
MEKLLRLYYRFKAFYSLLRADTYILIITNPDEPNAHRTSIRTSIEDDRELIQGLASATAQLHLARQAAETLTNELGIKGSED